MCATCGCGQEDVRVSPLLAAIGTTGVAGDEALDGHHHSGDHQHPHTIDIEQAVLARNDHLAEHNRARLQEARITMVNLMSSPGAGKTSLLERTIRDCHRDVSVIEGDQETLFDADRIRNAGAPAVQVNTGAGCHLDADMVGRALAALRPRPGSLVFVENVGNLVCPALFDLGEARRVVIVSVTEGDDKPLKYPHMFAAADLVVVNKTDLLPYVEFDLERFRVDARRLSPGIDVMPLSATAGDRLDDWYAWLDGS